MSPANSHTHSGPQGGGQAACLADTPHCTALLILLRRSCIPQAGQWVDPPYGPAQGFLAGSLSELLTPFLSVLTLQHAGIFCGG